MIQCVRPEWSQDFLESAANPKGTSMEVWLTAIVVILLEKHKVAGRSSADFTDAIAKAKKWLDSQPNGPKALEAAAKMT